MNITDEWVRAVAPNAAAARNGHALSERFDALCVSEDGTLLFGDCQGSGAALYTVWTDLGAPEAPVFHCTCPSRQTPCKHVLGLLYAFCRRPERFRPSPVPLDLAMRRVAAARPRRRARTTERHEEHNRALLQAEGLDVALRMAEALVSEGLGAQDTRKLAELRARNRTLGNYHLPGVQTAFARILRMLAERPPRAERPPPAEHSGTRSAFEELAVFYTLCRQARAYYACKAEHFTDAPSFRAAELYRQDAALETWCGRVWQLTDLARMGQVTRNARLIQLAFVSLDNPASGEMEDTGYWALLGPGETALSVTQTLRPRQALAHIREEDSCFGVVCAPALYRYPLGLRVRWDEFSLEEPMPEDYTVLISMAEPLGTPVKRLREALRDPLSPCLTSRRNALSGALPVIARLDALETAAGQLWLRSGDARVRLADAPDAPCRLLPLLYSPAHTAAFLLLRAHPDGEIRAEILSLVSPDGITRVGG